jgi:hypothetical protein
MQKNNNETKRYIVKFIKFYFLKDKIDYINNIISTQYNLIIVSGSVKQHIVKKIKIKIYDNNISVSVKSLGVMYTYTHNVGLNYLLT